MTMPADSSVALPAILPVVLPLGLPLVTAVASLFARRHLRLQAGLSVTGAAGLVGVAVWLLSAVMAHGPLRVQVGGWPAPFAISLGADALSAIMVLITGIVGFAGAVYALADVSRRQVAFGFVPLYHVLLMGVCGAFLTRDLFNLFVWFEVMLMASFVLLVLGGARDQMKGAIHYVTINLVSSAMFLVATGLIYAVLHTLDMADISVRLQQVAATRPWLVYTMAGLLLVSFGIKAGVYPLFGWLPPSYHTPPTVVSAVFAGLLTKVGVYALVRVLGGVFPPMPAIYTAALFAAGATMLIGVLGALAQPAIRRILSFHIISQIGYMVIGVGLLAAPSPEVRALGLAATVFYIVHHILVKANLFLVGGVMRVLGGDERLARLGGLARRAPWLAVLFAIPALSLAGMPPLSGFWAKLAVFQSTLRAGSYTIAAVAALTGLLTLMSMLKIWNAAFWKPAPPPAADDTGPARAAMCPLALTAMLVPIVLLAAMTVLIGLWPTWLFELSQQAATQILHPDMLPAPGIVGVAR